MINYIKYDADFSRSKCETIIVLHRQSKSRNKENRLFVILLTEPSTNVVHKFLNSLLLRYLSNLLPNVLSIRKFVTTHITTISSLKPKLF